jgi:hypothetical protein
MWSLMMGPVMIQEPGVLQPLPPGFIRFVFITELMDPEVLGY